MRKSLNNKLWLYYLVRKFWAKACQFDGIDPDSNFVSFSTANPYAIAQNRVMIRLQKLMKAA